MSDEKSKDLSAVEVNTQTELTDEDVVKSVGDRLRTAREEKSLDLRDVAAKTRQSQDTLAALETMETEHIPASILRLQARNYARFLGLPEDEVVAEYSEQRGTTNVAAMPNEMVQTKGPSKTVFIAGGAIAAAIVIVGGISMLLQSSQPSTDDQLAISARLAPATIEPSSLLNLAADRDIEFSLRANQAAWIEVRGSDGTVFRNRQMAAGEIYFPRLGAGWTITVRDAGAFEWQLGDDAFAPVGEAQQALYSVSVDGALEAAQDAQTAALAEAAASNGQRR